jgi:hypothetical protein
VLARSSAVALLLALFIWLLPVAGLAGVARADGAQPKAVIIVGPTHEQTAGNLVDGEALAQQAEAMGMDVRRVFFPYATWDNVLANIQGASLVAYLGHGYGWPSPYTTSMKESRQDGMGLNSYPGSGPAERTYYGASLIRTYVRLAPNAVVILNHLCYSAGNGEPGTGIPTEDLARQRADNMASGWLAAGARAVFASTWGLSLDMPRALTTTDATMDGLFMVPSLWGGAPDGFIGWNDVRLPSSRTPGALVHLDPHPEYGYMRALTGSLDMTSAEWRSGAGATAAPPSSPDVANAVALSAPKAAAFYAADADSLSRVTRLSIRVKQPAQVAWRLVNASGATVRTVMAGNPVAPGWIRFVWDGRADDGSWVPDGWYTSLVVTSAAGGSFSQERRVYVGAFRVTPSVQSPSRGDIVTLKVRSTEAMRGPVQVTINQPGVAPWTVTATHLVLRKYRASFTVNSGGDAGTVVLVVSGRDKYGGYQETQVTLSLR